MRSLVLVSFLCLAHITHAQEPDQLGDNISRFSAGIFCAPEVIGENPAPDTLAGVTNIIAEQPEFVSLSRSVPAVLGLGFGVISSVKAPTEQEVLIIVTHPPMRSDGLTRQSYSRIYVPGVESFTMYQFDYEYELVIGRWTITATDGERLLFRAGFDVTAPEFAPELADYCGYRELLS